ncbi:hypothetical protein B0H63DRAFT_81443 [Podospora didyma]|uniref:NACHT domain-containing protein n=1 Tax=Podospora didyma TaxID=330526 RepID=A0AAE0K295_9PEZI|nr:hypothetical protein B0H63DRAFT_81443 [Podospora didyma]
MMQDIQSQVSALSVMLGRLETLTLQQSVPSYPEMGRNELLDSAVSGQAPPEPRRATKTNHDERLTRAAVSRQVLRGLTYQSIAERFEDIEEAHKKTCEWVWQDGAQTTRSYTGKPQPTWSNLNRWLSDQSGVYWINGKAAAGKSTLMKYIVSHPRTEQLLAKWADDPSQLFVASYFFWASGSKEQRSQSGLLRSILYQVLSREPKLVPLVFPREWSVIYLRSLGYQSLAQNPNVVLEERLVTTLVPDQGNGPDRETSFTDQKIHWTLAALQSAFQRLLLQAEVPLSMCLFIDGLDEYDGDETEIARLFGKVSNSRRIKCCVSSRPHQAFIDAFEGRPTLRLEELSSPDIEAYVFDKLKQDDRMRRLAAQQPRQVDDLISDIVRSANGVFLWVKLVVASLLRGLGNRDRITDLHRRMSTFPRELEQLYEHMVHRVDEVYRTEASRMFQLVAEVMKIPRVKDLWPLGLVSLLVLDFAVENDVTMILAASRDFLSGDGVRQLSQDAATRVITRSGGLLELSHHGRGTNVSPYATVSYMHRTVKDYVQTPQTQHMLQQRTQGGTAAPYNTTLALLAGTTAALKLYHGIDEYGTSRAHHYIEDGAIYLKRASEDPKIDMAAFHPVASAYFQALDYWLPFGNHFRYKNAATIFWPRRDEFFMAAACGLDEYLGYMLSRQGNSWKTARTKPQLPTASIIAKNLKFSLDLSPRVLMTLLKFGADHRDIAPFAISWAESAQYHWSMRDPQTATIEWRALCKELRRSGYRYSGTDYDALRECFPNEDPETWPVGTCTEPSGVEEGRVVAQMSPKVGGLRRRLKENVGCKVQ